MSDELTATIDAGTTSPDQAVEDKPFDYSTIPPGHYDLVFRRRRGIQSKWHHLKFQRVLEKLEGYDRVLDVGCGPGTLLGMLGPEREAVGVDITQQQIEYARDVYGSPTRSFYACALEDLPKELGLFDAVSAVELIEHLPTELAEATLRNAVDRIRPGGRLVVTTPDFRSAWPLVEKIVDRLGDVEYYVQHINKFTRSQVRNLANRLGLVEVEVRAYLFAAPFAAALGWRTADRVARIEAGGIEDRFGLILIASGTKP